VANQSIDLKGWLVAEVEPEEWPQSHTLCGGRLFLFRTLQDWTLLRVRHVTHFDDEGSPKDGGGSADATSYPDLEALKADLERCGRSDGWPPLVKAGAANYDRDLMLLWTPVQIDLDLDRSSVHRRDFGLRGERRGQPGWQEEALALAVDRLEEIHFVVLEATSDHRQVFSRGLGKAWERTGNVVVGAVVAAAYGFRIPLVVAIDGAGEIYVRTADSSFDPGTRRRYPPRPLTSAEERRVEEIHQQRRAKELRRQPEEPR
jgi:hypothetical protein